MPFLTARDGIRIYYDDWGTGTPVVLIHGWPLNADMWERQATYLVEHGLRVITYDRRGFGRSCHPWSGYDYDTFAADLNSLMEKLDLRDATLVGFSMGGGEVVRYLTNHGDSRVSKAVMISAVPPFYLMTADNPEGVDPKMLEEFDKEMREDRPTFLRDFASHFYGRSLVHRAVSDAVMDWNQGMALMASLRATLAAAKAFSTTDFREEMKQITIPVRLIHGTSDATVPIDNSSRKSVQVLADATLTEYEGEPHGLFITAADRLNAELLSFITGTVNPTVDEMQSVASHKMPIPVPGSSGLL